MVNVNVKAPDIGFQAPDSKKTGSTGIKNTQSDQFKKLLQGKQDLSVRGWSPGLPRDDSSFSELYQLPSSCWG